MGRAASAVNWARAIFFIEAGLDARPFYYGEARPGLMLGALLPIE
jgi:hypothetical protein